MAVRSRSRLRELLTRVSRTSRQPGIEITHESNRRLRMEHLEDRRVLAQIVPVQSGGTALTSGGIDFLYMRANTATSNVVLQTDEVIESMRQFTDDFYRRNSSGNSFFNRFDVTPILDLTSQTFTSSGAFQAAARQAAENLGYNLSDYTRFGYGFGAQEFSIPGGAVGSGGATGGSLLFPDPLLTTGLTNSSFGFLHESFHTLGLGHANNLEYGDQIYDENRVVSAPLGSTPSATQAGIDPFSFMGSAGYAGEEASLSAYMKYYIGWVDATNVTVAPDDPTGVYRIYQNKNESLPVGQKIALQLGDGADPNGAIWLSYTPDDPNPDVVKSGVIASFIDPIRPAVDWRLDLTPNSRQPYDPNFADVPQRQVRVDLEDGAAAVGETYAIPGFEFEFTPIAEGGTGENQWVDIEVTKASVAVVDENRYSFDYDVGTQTSPVESGAEQVSEINAGNIDWIETVTSVDRGAGSTDTNRDFVSSSMDATFEHRVRNGLWQVTLTTGDANSVLDNMQVYAEGSLVAADIDAAVGQFATTVFNVEVTDGSLTLEFSDNGGTDDQWRLNGLSLELLEHRVDTSQAIYNYDFGDESSRIQEMGFLDPALLTVDDAGDITWTGDSIETFVNGVRGRTDEQHDGIRGDGTSTFEHKVENGVWRVSLLMGDIPALENMQVVAEGSLISDNIDTSANEYKYVTTGGGSTTEGFFDVLVTDGSLSIEISNSGGSTTGWSVNALSLRRVGKVIDTNLTSFKYDLGSAYTVLAPGYDRLTQEFRDGDVRFVGGTIDTRDRFRFSTFPEQRQEFAEFVFGNNTTTLEHKVSNGTWRVTMVMGDGLVPNSVTNASVRAEGELIDGDIDTFFLTGLDQTPSDFTDLEYVTRTGGSDTRASFDVDVSDGSLSLQLGGFWRLLSVELDKVGGDFDSDDDVDGADFLSWQRGFGTQYSSSDLQLWTENYAGSASAQAISTATAYANGSQQTSTYADTYYYDPDATMGGCGCGGVGCAACSTVEQPLTGGCSCGGVGCAACAGTATFETTPLAAAALDELTALEPQAFAASSFEQLLAAAAAYSQEQLTKANARDKVFVDLDNADLGTSTGSKTNSDEVDSLAASAFSSELDSGSTTDVERNSQSISYSFDDDQRVSSGDLDEAFASIENFHRSVYVSLRQALGGTSQDLLPAR